MHFDLRQSRLSRYIGDRQFYRALRVIVLPVILQNSLTNLVSLLDNIMVGAVGTEQMSGVSIVNQLLFVFNLCIFGGMSGAGIYTAQFFGKRDTEGVRNTFRFKFLLGLGLLAVGTAVFLAFGPQLIGLYLHEGSETGDLAATAAHGQAYLHMMLWGLIPFAIQQAYASTLRETGQTLLPMKAGLVAIFVNLCLNYVFIFGHLGMPAMGAVGAALATVIARWVEFAIIAVWTHRHHQQAPFIIGAYRSMRIPGALVGSIIRKGMPLLVNEALWSAGMATLTQSYSTRGLAVVAGMNISSTISNLFSAVWLSMGTAVAIMVGQELGANRFERAKDTVRKLAAFSVAVASALALALVALAPLFPHLYNTTDEVRDLATGFLRISMLASPIHAFANAAYFALRSGGKTWITFLFDSAYLWVISVPMAKALTLLTPLPIMVIYAVCSFIDIIKCVIGYIMLKKGVWIHNIVDSV